MSFHESEMSHNVTSNSEMDSSCGEYQSSQSECGSSGSEDGEGDLDGDGNGDHEGIMESCSQMQESEQDHYISEHDKISARDCNEDNCDGFRDFLEMLE